MIYVEGLYQKTSSDMITPNRILSPCIKVCKVLNRRCVGCGRTIEEITNWTKYTDVERETIIKRDKQ